MNQTKKNIFTILFLSPLTIIVSIIFTPLIIDLFGISNYGIFALMINLVAFSGLFNLGLGVAGTRYISQISIEDEKELLRTKINNNFFVTFIIALFFSLLLFLCFNFLIKNIYNFSDIDERIVLSLNFLICITVFLNILLLSFRGYLVGLNKLNLAKMNEVFLVLSSLIITYSLLQFGLNISEIFLVRLIPLLLYLSFVLLYLFRKKSIILNIDNLNYTESLKQFKYGLRSFININSPYIKEIPLLLIGVFLTPISVAIYTPFKIMINAIYVLIVNLNENIFPLVSARSLNNDDKATFFDNIFYGIIAYSFLIHILFIFGAETIVHLWLGETFSSKILILHVMSIGSFGYSISSALFYFSQGVGKPEIGRNYGIYLGILNIIFGIMLIPEFNLLGASISFSFSIFLIVILMIRYFNNKIFYDMVSMKSISRILFFFFGIILITYNVFSINGEMSNHFFISILSLIFFFLTIKKTNFRINSNFLK